MSLLLKTSQRRTHAQQIIEFLKRGEGKCAVLTGAGVSTDSGVPDYRGPSGVYVRNKDYKPIRYQEFVSSHAIRQRYWARSYLGYPRILQARPNRTHVAIHELEKTRWINGIVTQNVDGLHLGNNVLELHGSLHTIPRAEFQRKLSLLNPVLAEWATLNPDRGAGDVASSVNPDGDLEITWDYSDFVYPACDACGVGMYKPSVVFFGENIPSTVRDESFSLIDTSNSVLAVGTSLQVYSAFRLVQRAKVQGKRVAVLSLGPTRADGVVDVKVDDGSSDVLEDVVEGLA
ncbi:hypothetical protein SpCBS45565_g04005 [Spizellomyces sp. 'palustris']|nr:hypothetical protein SpCBS45565_g04005 [Spizellomyces sp. 'palustris']